MMTMMVMTAAMMVTCGSLLLLGLAAAAHATSSATPRAAPPAGPSPASSSASPRMKLSYKGKGKVAFSKTEVELGRVRIYWDAFRVILLRCVL